MRPISLTHPQSPEIHIARDMETLRKLKVAGWRTVSKPVTVREGEAKKRHHFCTTSETPARIGAPIAAYRAVSAFCDEDDWYEDGEDDDLNTEYGTCGCRFCFCGNRTLAGSTCNQCLMGEHQG